uniref:Uncharacterized protein n=1 Tax=Trichuris muris TaxID=70415 RepID=A0A5S6Q1M9_TRIMR
MYVVNSYLSGGCSLLGRRRCRPTAAVGEVVLPQPQQPGRYSRKVGNNRVRWVKYEEQAGRDKEYEDYVRGEQPQPKWQRYVQADRRILAIIRRHDRRSLFEYLRGIAQNFRMGQTTYSATLRMVASTDPSDALQPLSEDRWAKHKSAEVVQDRITTFAQNSDRILRCTALAKLLVRSLSTTGPS